MTNPIGLAAANVAFVRQGIALLEAIDDAAFTCASPPIYHSGVGAHLRHCIDHYVRFLDGRGIGFVDYDARDRDRRIETDRFAARRALEVIAAGLAAIAADDLERPLEVVIDCHPGDDGAPAGLDEAAAPACPSTVRRELLFLVSHTVHHYALIALILRHQGIDIPAGFGVAPSTLRHHGGRFGAPPARGVEAAELEARPAVAGA